MSPQRAPASKQRLTAAQIAAKPAPEPAVGARLYQPTNELAFGPPFLGYSGRFGDEVYHWRGGKCFVRRYATPPPPGTARQLDHQDRMRTVMPSWTTLPADVRRAWLEYSIRHFGEDQLGKKRGNLGQNLYTQAQLNRLAWGDDLSALPPAAPPPPRAIQVVEVPAPEGQIAWRVDHGLSQTTGYKLEVRTTPGTTNKPLNRRLVRAGTTTPGSFFPLQQSGTIYLLEHPLHAITPGERYGLQVKLITPDGIEGKDLILDLDRKPSGALPSATPTSAVIGEHHAVASPGNANLPIGSSPGRAATPESRARQLHPSSQSLGLSVGSQCSRAATKTEANHQEPGGVVHKVWRAVPLTPKMEVREFGVR